MSTNENVARNLRRVKEERHLSIEIFAQELAIPKSSAQIYLKGEGNLTLKTAELIAEKLGMSVTELISAHPPGWEQAEIVAQTAKVLSALPPEKREACTQHLLAIAAIFAETETK